MMKKKFIPLFILLFYMLNINSQEFIHPGLLHSESSLKRIRELVRNEIQPAYGSFNIMRGMPEGKADYCIKGPFETISRAGRYGYTKDPCERDFNAAYYNAILWIVTGKEPHADKAMEIIRAYASTLKKIEGPDDPLCAGLQGFMLVNAAEIMRYTYTADKHTNGWDAKDTPKVENMFRNVFQPILTTFYNTKPYTNGNWGIAVTKAQMAFGVFLNDKKLYEDAIEFFLKSHDNGTLPNYVAESGQIQESGRDQQHAMLGLGCLSEIAEIAWTQGRDLYGALDNRLMKGYEYLAKSNLGYEVPFFTWKDITGKYSNWTTLGEEGMGRFRSLFEIAYNHYVERKGLEMPYTQIVLGMIRPEGPGFTCDNPGFGSLLFYLGKDLNMETYYSVTYPIKAQSVKFITAIILKDSPASKNIPQVTRLKGDDLQGVRIAKGDKITDVYLNTRADGHIMHRNSCTNVNGWDTDAYLLAFSYKKGTDPAVSKNILEWFIGYGSYVRNANESIFDSYTKKYKVIR